MDNAAEIATDSERHKRRSYEAYGEFEVEGEEVEEEIPEKKVPDDPPPSPQPSRKILEDYYFGSATPDPNAKKFIACEEQWFKTLDEFSVFRSLLECPALLAVNESGALDITQWISNYLLSTGVVKDTGDGVLIGRLQDWNYVEELVPIQMIQVSYY
jgi:hypothetical protein